MGPDEHRRKALVHSVEEAKKTAHWWQAGVIAVAVLVVFGLLAVFTGKVFGGAWFLIFKGVAALGAAAGIRAGARRARRAARQLPDPEALAVLKPLTEHQDETTRKIAAELVEGLHPEGTEVVPSAIPEGRGTEVVVSSAPQKADG